MSALAGGDTRRLLTAVLERVEAEIGKPRDVVRGCVYAKHPAFITRPSRSGIGRSVGIM